MPSPRSVTLALLGLGLCISRPGDRGAELTGSLLFGLRHSFGDCAHLYHARGWRIFATARTWVTEGRGITAVAGFEIDPSLLFSGEDDGYWDALDRGVAPRCFRAG